MSAQKYNVILRIKLEEIVRKRGWISLSKVYHETAFSL